MRVRFVLHGPRPTVAPLKQARIREQALQRERFSKAQAGAVGRLSHTHERGVVMLDAALAGQILAYATGHLEGMPELRRLAAEAAPDARRTLEELVEIGVLPTLVRVTLE